MIAVKLKACSGCKQLKQIWKSDKKHKYCRECWYKIQPPKSSHLPPVSKKMQTTMNEYTKKRKAYLAMFSTCQAGLQSCTGSATDVHHKAGRGENHLTISTWLAVCRSCHNWIELNPAESKELGFSESRLHK